MGAARKAGHQGPHLIESLLSRRKWRWELVRRALPQLAPERLRDDLKYEDRPGRRVDEILPTCARASRPWLSTGARRATGGSRLP